MNLESENFMICFVQIDNQNEEHAMDDSSNSIVIEPIRVVGTILPPRWSRVEISQDDTVIYCHWNTNYEVDKKLHVLYKGNDLIKTKVSGVVNIISVDSFDVIY